MKDQQLTAHRASRDLFCCDPNCDSGFSASDYDEDCWYLSLIHCSNRAVYSFLSSYASLWILSEICWEKIKVLVNEKHGFQTHHQLFYCGLTWIASFDLSLYHTRDFYPSLFHCHHNFFDLQLQWSHLLTNWLLHLPVQLHHLGGSSC